MKKLEASVVQHYESQTLDGNKLEALLSESRRVRQKRWYRRVAPLSAVASLLGLLLLGALYFQGSSSLLKGHIILQEASLNHKSKLQLDFKSQELSTLAMSMNKLDFPLLLPESMRQQFKVQGARYCTLNGKLAAHVKLSNGAGDNSVSLFMTQNRKEFSDLVDQSEDIDGVQVSSWTADGMFYVLASNKISL